MEKGAKPWNGEPQYGAASIGAKVRVWWAGLGQFIDGYIMAYDAERRQSRYLVLYDHDFELLWSAAPVPGTGHRKAGSVKRHTLVQRSV